MHTIINPEPDLWTVGYGEGRDWTPLKDFDDEDEAIEYAAYLNGAPRPSDTDDTAIGPLPGDDVQIVFLSGDVTYGTIVEPPKSGAGPCVIHRRIDGRIAYAYNYALIIPEDDEDTEQ
jgi:hypothetical protein